MFNIYKHFLKSTPEYLARYYWWAYLWPRSVWFFDHQPIINAILFGQYNRLLQQTLAELATTDHHRVLQLTCVYGKLTPNLIKAVHPAPLHITDVACVQLALAKSKATENRDLLSTRMNAEYLGYQSNVFSTVVLFFLLHEMPPEARAHTLSEAIRVLAPGGSLLITEYAELPRRHLLYRFFPTRWLTTKLEPFLNGFWHENMADVLQQQAIRQEKTITQLNHTAIFNNFYRVTSFKVSAADRARQ